MGDLNLVEASASQIQTALSNGSVSVVQLVEQCLYQIRAHNDRLRAVIQIAPPSILKARAEQLDEERKRGHFRGPLHGIPILLKDNIATHPSLGMGTTAGSFALLHSKPKANAMFVDGLLSAGAIIIGKANLSELANYKGPGIPCGWSAVGGQTQSAYIEGGFNPKETFGGHSNPGGSSSGSAVAVSAGFVPIAIGTESCGSLVMPANRAALYTMKPTIGLISQHGLVPGSDFCDSAGPLAKTALDVANTLQALVDPAQKDRIPEHPYASFAQSSWQGIRVGALDPTKWRLSQEIGGNNDDFDEQTAIDVLRAYKLLQDNGADIKWPVSLISHKEAAVDGKDPLSNLLDGHFEKIMNDYLQGLDESPVRSLRQMIEFNDNYSLLELPPGYSTQSELIGAVDFHWSNQDDQRAIARCHEIARERGIDKTLKENDIDVILGPADSDLDNVVAMAGYPYVALPFSYFNGNGRPMGLVAIAGRYQEALLIKVMSAWEATVPRRRCPKL